MKVVNIEDLPLLLGSVSYSYYLSAVLRSRDLIE